MGSIDAEVEIDMEISDDEQECSKGTTVTQVVNHSKIEYSRAGQLSADTDSSRKRKQSSFLETSPSVRVVYNNLSRESRKRLQDLLRQWSEWQGWHSRRYVASRDDPVESGDEQYFPALQIGPTASSFSVSFWVDRPAKQARRKDADDTKDNVKTSSQDRESEADVPLYDRVIPSLSSQETREDGYIELEREATRCFNCGSYSHALRDCQRPRNNEAINSARFNHNSKKGFQSGPRVAARYYQSPPGSKYDDLKPGMLGSEARQLLGVGENDPPPWLHQTRELGHPPGYSGRVDETSREVSATDEKEEKENKTLSTEEGEEGEIVDDVEPQGAEEELYIAFSTTDQDSQESRTTADFPGTNSPFPEHLDERLWRQAPPVYAPGHTRSSYHQRPVSLYPPRTSTYGSPAPGPYALNPHRPWEGRNQQYREIGSPAWETGAPRAAASAPIAIPVAKKDDDDWELNFESSVYRSESSRSSSVPRGVVGYHDTVSQGLTVNTAVGFSPAEPSQLSPTGSGYGESFRPSSGYNLPSPTPPDSRNGRSTPPLPSQVSQYFESVQTSVHYLHPYQTMQAVDPQPNKAWVQAQAALSSMQTGQKGDGYSEPQTN